MHVVCHRRITAPLQVYVTPQYFTEDWLNEYYDAKSQQQQQQQQHDTAQQQQQQQQQVSQLGEAEGVAAAAGASVVTSDYRFVYCGPAGSWTPVHAGDRYHTTSVGSPNLDKPYLSCRAMTEPVPKAVTATRSRDLTPL
jgi:hypothetical protein